ncbi:MAG TPA: helix-turn-helix domain-containing protein [Syntrophorhabdaceae bacterium]|nr:helix-turn-helix domain-containing protein [Syntrophorhabdaceae bacterium]
MNVGQKIRRLREERGLKQINLANALQVSPQAVSKWERGSNQPDVDALIKIARLFDVSTDYLLGITDAANGIFEATVLCSGIAHFAERAASMTSKETADYVNVLFYHLTESALKFDGVPVKCVGDGFLSFFSGPHHADRAVKAARHAKKVIFQKELVIALNSGDIYLGLVGHPHYAMRDIVGETVNNAFIILEWISRNCPSGIGTTEAVIKRLKEAYKTRLHPKVAVDLIKKAFDIYEIL